MFILRRVILAFYNSKKLQFLGLHNNSVPAGCFLAAVLEIKKFQTTKFISELLKIYCNLFLRVLIQLSNSQKLTVRLSKWKHNWMLKRYSCTEEQTYGHRQQDYSLRLLAHKKNLLDWMLEMQSGSILHSDRNEWELILNILSQPILGTYLLFTF